MTKPWHRRRWSRAPSYGLTESPRHRHQRNGPARAGARSSKGQTRFHFPAMISDSPSLARAASIEDLRCLARRKLPRMVFDYIDGAAGAESTAQRNRVGFDRFVLQPEILVDLSRSWWTAASGTVPTSPRPLPSAPMQSSWDDQPCTGWRARVKPAFVMRCASWLASSIAPWPSAAQPAWRRCEVGSPRGRRDPGYRPTGSRVPGIDVRLDPAQDIEQLVDLGPGQAAQDPLLPR